MDESYFKGRGAQIRTESKYLKAQYATDHIEGLDEALLEKPSTQIFHESAKKIVNKVNSPDLHFGFSMNPYQGCEHGCIYCYARNTHEYYGFSAGLDFETKIIVKENAPALLEKHLLQPTWQAVPIMLSGNTDCYQPQEKKYQITRRMLQILARYQHPVGIITKNALISRDVDILKELAQNRLVHVMMSITTLDESLRGVMEPRTASAPKRLKTVELLAKEGIPVGVMMAPVIPGLNHHEIPNVVKASAEHGALTCAMSVIRLNGSVAKVFEDWMRKNFPDRFEKVWNQISELHGGSVNDSTFGRRMSGEGNIANSIHQLFRAAKNKYFKNTSLPPLDLTKFRKGGNLNLFT
ncbi:MAG: PA0069 family radical SAM protein [Cyclobacteriaceae bacterium]